MKDKDQVEVVEITSAAGDTFYVLADEVSPDAPGIVASRSLLMPRSQYDSIPASMGALPYTNAFAVAARENSKNADMLLSRRRAP